MKLRFSSHKFFSVFQKSVTVAVLSAAVCSQSLIPVQGAHVDSAVTSSPLDSSWPSGPSVGSETAILIEADTGTILYEKDAHKQMYPASITKTLTTLIATEMCDLDEDVVFTQETLSTIPYDSSRIWVDRDEYMPMEDCLAAILIVSANDVAAGVAEHIGGTLEAFSDIMNERAKELGCLNTHFVNAHGYHDPDHYTTAYDMAQIGRAFFENDLLCSLAKERVFHVDPSPGQPDNISELNTNKLLATREYEYEYLVGSKTGYTSQAGQTLISCAQKDGMKLICVVMNAQRPDQYKDTITLFDFGFSNFTTTNIYDNDSTYVSADSSYGVDVKDVLGDSTPMLSMNTDATVVLPKNASFADTTSYITMDTEEENCMAVAHYQYGTHEIGTAKIYVTATADPISEDAGAMDQAETTPVEEPEEKEPIYINLLHIALYILGAVAIISAFYYLYRWYYGYGRSRSSSSSKRRAKQPLNKLRNTFILFAQGLQAIWYFFKGRIASVAMRSRYKNRGSASVMSPIGRSSNADRSRKDAKNRYESTSRTHYKNVVFHDLDGKK